MSPGSRTTARAASVEGALARFDVIGGTAPDRVATELARPRRASASPERTSAIRRGRGHPSGSARRINPAVVMRGMDWQKEARTRSCWQTLFLQ